MPGFYDVTAVGSNIFLPGATQPGGSRTLWLTDAEIADYSAKAGVTLTPNTTANSAAGTNGVTRYRDLDTTDSYATDSPKVVVITASFTLSAQDHNKIFRNDSGTAITVTVPNSLPEGFHARFARYGAGNVTIAAGSGATSRSAVTATTAQYKELIFNVRKNTTGAAAEYIVTETN